MRAICLSILLCLVALASPAQAQWVLNSNGATITNTNACPASNIVRTFEVAQVGPIADVDLGFDADHTWRGDIRLRLSSPGGTTVEVVSANTGAGGNFDNYRIRLDDAAVDLVNTGGHATNTGAGVARYNDRVRPSNPLSAFNGQNTAGTWTLEICDAFPAQDNGTLFQTTLFITPTATPQPPALTCPVNTPIPFVWGAPGSANGWAPGSLVNGYNVGPASDPISLAFAVTGDTGQLIPRNGTATPNASTELSSTGTAGLLINGDFGNRSQSVLVALNLGTPGTGVSGAQFTVQDVDRDGWSDRVVVNAALGGAAVSPVITPGLANSVNANTLDGQARTPSGTTESEATITFSQPIDRIELTYTNAPGQLANPEAQVMGFFANLRVCAPVVAMLSAVKSVELIDPNGLDLKMTPGESVLYRITVTHDGASPDDATDVAIADTLPPTLKFVSSSFTGFTAGGFANQNCPAGACTVNFENGVLPSGSTGEILVTATIR